MATSEITALPLLPLRSGVVFPGTTIPLPVGREKSTLLARSLSPGDLVLLGIQRDSEEDEPGLADLLPVAVLAKVARITRARAGVLHVVVQAKRRVELRHLAQSHPYWRAEYGELAEEATTPEALALAEALIDKLRQKQVAMSSEIAERLASVNPSRGAGRIADLVSAALGLPSDKEIPLLVELDPEKRLRLVHEFLAEAANLAELKDKIDREVHHELSKSQREVLLRQQLDAIRRELGEDGGDDASDLRQRLQELELPEEVHEVVLRELSRLERANPASPEVGVARKYLELIADLPWGQRADVVTDIDAIEARLDDDHYGLGDVKRRILEHLAVAKLTGNQRGAILSLAGPPGVGKTSLGQSIADATGRPFVRVSLGGVRDEAEIRGHRRTYVGALPGRIVAAIRRAGVKNPVVLLDEIDKLGQGFMGSPEAALLEVLDPEQNSTFTDHYLEVPFDLSEVLFICTANNLAELSAPLRDRLEIIEVEGYSLGDKTEIARHHLWPAILEENGLTGDVVTLTDDALEQVVHDYTRESGVRQLGRELRRLARRVTLDVARHAEGKAPARTLDDAAVESILGKPKFHSEVAERTSMPGIATGLAWTPVGGDILFIETSRMPGKGRLEITGQLGDVMKESARAALTYVKSHAAELAVDPVDLEAADVHVHVPAGGIPKDGPSAGVTIFTALTSLFSGRRVRPDTAMTGECTLRGRVLPVGGIKSKVLAAHRAGLSRIVLPERNRRDVDDIPKNVVADLEIVFASDMTQVLESALLPLDDSLSSPPETGAEVRVA